MNNTNPILSDELEKMKNRKLLEEYFSRSLEVELLLRLYPDDEDTIYQIVDLLGDTCAPNSLAFVHTLCTVRKEKSTYISLYKMLC